MIYVKNEGLVNLCFSEKGRARLRKISKKALAKKQELEEGIDSLCESEEFVNSYIYSEKERERHFSSLNRKMKRMKLELNRINGLIQDIKTLTS